MFPAFRQAYTQASGRMLDVIHGTGIPAKWETAEDMFLWWMEKEQNRWPSESGRF